MPFEAPDQDVRIAVLHGDEPEQAVLAHLDAGRVLMLPEIGFEGRGLESLGHWPEGKSKTVSLDPADRTVKGAPADVAHRTVVANAMADYAEWSKALLGRIAPSYGRRAAPGRTSFRARSADRAPSPRKDDRRLHIDAFPSQPAQDRRILRVFRNVDPSGAARIWQVGEPFADHAARFAGRARRLAPGEAWLLRCAGVTKARRSPYDQLMLGIHDAAKADDDYQARAPRQSVAFPARATWILFSDAAPHAVVSGRWAFEQTFFLPVAAMANPAASPLRTLERMLGRRLA